MRVEVGQKGIVIHCGTGQMAARLAVTIIVPQ
jgi:hypothetical protein